MRVVLKMTVARDSDSCFDKKSRSNHQSRVKSCLFGWSYFRTTITRITIGFKPFTVLSN